MAKTRARRFLKSVLLPILLSACGGGDDDGEFAAPPTAATIRASIDSKGIQGNLDSHSPSITSDGRYVAFQSLATNLVPEDTNGAWDIFVHDTVAGTTVRASLNSSGIQGDSDSFSPSISANGRYVAFESIATNLAAGDANGAVDIFVRDLLLEATSRVSVDASGIEGNGHSNHPSISSNGRYVAFQSLATNLVSGDVNGAADVFFRDTVGDATFRASVDSAGVPGNGFSDEPSISADGRRVAFRSAATNLVAGDANGEGDIFVRDVDAGTTTLASVSSDEVQGDDFSDQPAISADGGHVAFRSGATNLVAGDTNGSPDIFVRDLAAGTTARASVGSGGAQGDGFSNLPSISADGRRVAFSSNASTLAAGDTNGAEDVFVFDAASGGAVRVSVDSTGAQGNDGSTHPMLSGDGRHVAMASYASALCVGDSNSSVDVFRRGPLK